MRTVRITSICDGKWKYENGIIVPTRYNGSFVFHLHDRYGSEFSLSVPTHMSEDTSEYGITQSGTLAIDATIITVAFNLSFYARENLVKEPSWTPNDFGHVYSIFVDRIPVTDHHDPLPPEFPTDTTIFRYGSSNLTSLILCKYGPVPINPAYWRFNSAWVRFNHVVDVSVTENDTKIAQIGY